MKQQIYLFLILIQAIGMMTAIAQNPSTNIDIQNNNINISASEDIRLSTGASGKAYYNDKEIAVKNDASRSATIVIAASNASEKSKSGADFVCTGVNDQEVFNTALNNLPECGGVIQLTEGDFHFYNTNWGVDKDVTIQGAGISSVINRHFVHVPGQFADFADSMLRGSTKANWHFKDFLINANHKITNGENNFDIFCWTPDSGKVEGTCVIENVHVINGMKHGTGDMTVAFFVAGCNARIINCSIEGGYTRPIQVSIEGRTPMDAYVSGCYTNGQILVAATNAFVVNNKAENIYINSFGKSVITGNITDYLSLVGNNILVSNNIYNTLYNSASNTLITNNLTQQ